MTPTPTITVDENKRCRRCGKPGATDGGYCLRCILRNLNEGRYDAILKRKGRT